jgi:hypothetical protein
MDLFLFFSLLLLELFFLKTLPPEKKNSSKVSPEKLYSISQSIKTTP